MPDAAPCVFDIEQSGFCCYGEVNGEVAKDQKGDLPIKPLREREVPSTNRVFQSILIGGIFPLISQVYEWKYSSKSRCGG
jgi:hypothetical protein